MQSSLNAESPLENLKTFLLGCRRKTIIEILRLFFCTLIQEKAVSESGSILLTKGDKLKLFNKDNFLIQNGFLPPNQDWKEEFSCNEGIAGRAFIKRKTVVVNDVNKDSDWVTSNELPIRSIICVPIIINPTGPPYGIVNFHNSPDGQEFNNQTKELIETYVETLALALESTQLLENIQNKCKDLEEALQKKSEDLEVKILQLKNYHDQQKKVPITILFSITFLCLFILGLIINKTGIFYLVIAILIICCAGGLGSTTRKLAEDVANGTEHWNVVIQGMIVGLFVTIISALPYLNESNIFVIPNSAETISVSMRIQFISGSVIAFLAGLAYDVSLRNMLLRGRRQAENIISNDKEAITKDEIS